MNVFNRINILLSLLSYFVIRTRSEVVTYQLRNNCGGLIQVGGGPGTGVDEGLIHFESNDGGRIVEPGCSVTIQPMESEQKWNQVSFKIMKYQNFDKLCFTFKEKHPSGRLDNIYDVPDCHRNALTFVNKTDVIDRGTGLFLELSRTINASHQSYDPSAKMLLYFNVFINGGLQQDSCEKKHGHHCLNGRCIPSTIKCSKYNPCGDGSSCDEKEVATGNIAVGIGIAAGAGCIIILCLCVNEGCKRYRNWMIPGDFDNQTNIQSVQTGRSFILFIGRHIFI
ncbi:uncharacterized protein LOC128220220 isoform X2 [Mya arenaria]|uniref:uncharacterized protein LOC128220220 isoform X2 n=1 Tax=Mya arenaria TaxID=6604 RepID=UPI0022E8B2C4|nr:uncharacterized protein LOC128220220 isoform X2 [Mya arenaria]